jgi:pSer/pThr/pTyr-binding forkhead associated (FHA) protein/tetratricopeptide (TPR) repeat protein
VFKLTIEDDEGKTTVIPVVRDEMTIGRQEGNTIRLTERNVSRRHARVVRQNGGVFIEDLASFTGVRVNGLKITALTPFRDGDHVQIGDYKIGLKVERPPMIDGGDRPTMPTMHAVMGTTAQYGAPVLGRNGNVPMVAPADTEIPTAPLLRFPSPANMSEIPLGNLPVPASMEAQPTIPLRRLDDPPPEPVEQIAPPARLVILSTELAGMEFSLTRPSVVIGRTDENDITLNHRSISRHHAKIVRERDHYTILDLQSANGVRVNGEDYERIELHAGDMVELGHVRVRFVGPGETFVFDAKAVMGGARFPAKAAMTLVGIALAAVAIVVYQRGNRPNAVERLPEVAENHPAANPPPAAAAEIPAPAAPAPEPVAPAAAPATPAELLAKAATDAKSEDWDAALSSLDQMTARPDEVIDPRTRRHAADLRRKVESERRGGVAFAKFEQSSTAKNYAEALERFAEIPNDSLYKKRARPRFEEARTLYVAQHLTAAEKFRAGGKCTEAKAEAEQVEKVDPNNALVKELVRMCKPRGEPAAAVALAGARPPRPRPVATSASLAKAEPAVIRQAAETTSEKAEAPAAEAEPDADALIKQAREAWLRQQCGSAIDLSRKALKARPGLVDAYQVIAVCSCSLKDAESAGRAYAKLDERSRSLVKALCVKHGITVGGE